MKSVVKSICGLIICRVYGIKNHRSNVYIHHSNKFVGGKFMEIEANVQIRPYGFFSCDKGGRIVIGNGSDLGERTRIGCLNSIEIGKDVLFGPNVYLSDMDHKYNMVGIPILKQGHECKEEGEHDSLGIKIGEGSWIGINSVIIGNVYIGKGSVIGANSVVTRDIPDNCIAIGSPCKVVKKYNPETLLWERANY